jgi:hypothetical protein
MAGPREGLLKAEMKRRNLTYEQLAERLAEIGAQHASPRFYARR